jgi:hypothetical protein
MKKFLQTFSQSQWDVLYNDALVSQSVEEKVFSHQVFTDSKKINSSISLTTGQLSSSSSKNPILKVSKILLLGTTITFILFPHISHALEETNATLAEEFFLKNPIGGLILASLSNQTITTGKKPGNILPALPSGGGDIPNLGSRALTPKRAALRLLQKSSSVLASASSSAAIVANSRKAKIALNSLGVLLNLLAISASLMDTSDFID